MQIRFATYSFFNKAYMHHLHIMMWVFTGWYLGRKFVVGLILCNIKSNIIEMLRSCIPLITLSVISISWMNLDSVRESFFMSLPFSSFFLSFSLSHSLTLSSSNIYRAICIFHPVKHKVLRLDSLKQRDWMWLGMKWSQRYPLDDTWSESSGFSHYYTRPT